MPSVSSAQRSKAVVDIPIPASLIAQTKSNFYIVLEFFKDKGKDVAKTIGYTCSWMIQLFPSMPANAQVIADGMKNTKNFFSALELPEKIMKFHHAVVSLVSDTTLSVVQKVRNFVKEGTGLFNAFADTTELSSIYLPVGKEFLHSVKTLNLGATFLGAGNSAVENIQKYASTKASEQERQNLYMINTARDVSYFVFAGYVLGCAFMGATVVSAVVLGLLSSGLAFTMAGFYYERKVDPEKKGMNVPSAVIDHFKREVAMKRRRFTASAA